MTAIDGRMAAWARSWQLVVAAQNWRCQLGATTESAMAELPDQYWAMLAEADAFNNLANAPGEVGWAAGTLVHEAFEAAVAEQSAEAVTKFEDLVNAQEEKPRDPACTCSWSRQSCLVHPWPPGDSNRPGEA